MEDLSPKFQASRFGYVRVSRVWGRLTAAEDLGMVLKSNRREHRIRCHCECGRMTDVPLSKLQRGYTRSCGCLKREWSSRLGPRKRTHGASQQGEQDHRLYRIWCGMHKRCRNTNHPAYQFYGGRGIVVCVEWDSFEPFRDWSKAHGYRADLSLDRYPNKNGPYSPDNCRWATKTEQARNSRSNRLIHWRDATKCIAEWAEDPRCSVKIGTIWSRLLRGWTVEDALSTPPQQGRKPVKK
jgi:hypothetical protein